MELVRNARGLFLTVTTGLTLLFCWAFRELEEESHCLAVLICSLKTCYFFLPLHSLRGINKGEIFCSIMNSHSLKRNLTGLKIKQYALVKRKSTYWNIFFMARNPQDPLPALAAQTPPRTPYLPRTQHFVFNACPHRGIQGVAVIHSEGWGPCLTTAECF